MAGLMPGDRIPDFARPDPAGKPLMFYDLHLGQPMALFILGRAAQARPALTALTDAGIDWGEVTRVAVVLGSPAECATLTQGLNPVFPVMVDDGALTQHLLGGSAAVTAFVLDDNLRITDRLQAGADLKAFMGQVAGLYAARPSTKSAMG